jgi:molecular chaperone DnaJ
VVAGSDLRYELTITLAEAVTGVTREIRFPTLAQCATCAGSGAEPGSEPERCPECNGTGERRRVSQTILGQMVNITACPRCNGEGRVISTPCHACKGDGRLREDRRIQVAVPAGIETGQRIALDGQGEAGPRGGPPGDLFVVVAVREEADLVRHGSELYAEVPVTFTQAALGAKVPVRTVDGTEEVEVPPGTQSGQEIRLRGRGMPRLRGAGRGDLHVLVTVVIPAKLTKRERELLQQLGEASGPAVLPKSGPSLGDRLRDLFG